MIGQPVLVQTFGQNGLLVRAPGSQELEVVHGKSNLILVILHCVKSKHVASDALHVSVRQQEVEKRPPVKFLLFFFHKT